MMNGIIFSKALEYLSAFEGKYDLGGEPYVFHLIEVSTAASNEERFAKYGVDMGKLAVCGLLHDVIDDTSYNEESTLNHGIPKDIVKVVSSLTKREGEEYNDYIQRLITASFRYEDPSILIVKLCDLEHNMNINRLGRDLTQKDLERMKRYLKAHRDIENALTHHEIVED